jgi:hypothetical protein
MAMLHWFNLTFNDNTSNRKLFFKLKVLYVDDSCLELINPDNNLEYVLKERKIRMEILKNLCAKYKFSFDIINLEDVLSIPVFNDLVSNEGSNYDINLTTNISNMEKISLADEKNISVDLMKKYVLLYKNISKVGNFNRDFNKIMTRNLIFNYAIRNNFNKIVLGSSAQGLVNNIFSNIIKGRGFAIREEIGCIDSHYLGGKLLILKPLKDFLAKEVLLFNYLNNVELIFQSIDTIKEKSTVRINTPFQGSTNTLIEFFFDYQQVRIS